MLCKRIWIHYCVLGIPWILTNIKHIYYLMQSVLAVWNVLCFVEKYAAFSLAWYSFLSHVPYYGMRSEMHIVWPIQIKINLHFNTLTLRLKSIPRKYDIFRNKAAPELKSLYSGEQWSLLCTFEKNFHSISSWTVPSEVYLMLPIFKLLRDNDFLISFDDQLSTIS